MSNSGPTLPTNRAPTQRCDAGSVHDSQGSLGIVQPGQRWVRGSAPSPTLGEPIDHWVLLPASYDGERRFATLHLLHGRGEDLHAWTRVAPALDAMVQRGDVPPLLVVLPDAPWSHRASFYVDSRFTGDPPGRPVETAVVGDLVAHVDATYRTLADREHRFVGGCSMGGAGALRLVLAHDEVFSGALVLSPAVYVPLPPAASSTRVSGAFGRGGQRFLDATYQELSHVGLLAGHDPARPVRLALAVGDAEWRHPDPVDARHDVDRETAAVHALAQRTPGVVSRLRVLPGGHDWDLWERAFVDGLPFVVGAAS